MPGLLAAKPVTDEQRRANDTHRPVVVFAVLGVLFIYTYLFTHVSDPLHIPAPLDLAVQTGLDIDHVFDSDRNVDSQVGIVFTQRFATNDRERLVLYLVIAAAFLCVYFLPLPYKQPSLVAWSFLGILILYGARPTAALLFVHLLIYLILHPVKDRRRFLALLAGLLGTIAFGPRGAEFPWQLGFTLGLSGAAFGFYTYALVPLLEKPRIAPVLRTVVVQSAIITVCISALIEGPTGTRWSLPLGLLLFFWQWERVIMYHIDYKDGLVPKDLSLWKYLSVFFCPAMIPNWFAGVAIGQGYYYTQNNFLCEDKNRLVIAGLKILGVALLYLVFADWITHQLVVLFTGWGIPVHRARTTVLVGYFASGGTVTTATVLCTTMLDQLRWLLYWGGIVHFKVGVWRICGYRMDPYYHRPWFSTNLMTLWSRYAFHQREFLVRAFYYPVFFRFFKQHTKTRILAATIAAAGIANLVWAHVTEKLYFGGMMFDNIVYVLRTWPYFVLLSLGIAVCQIYLLHKKRTRKPWTWGPRIGLDVLAVYCTLQFFSLIHIFARPSADSTLWDHTRLFLIGLGIHISP